MSSINPLKSLILSSFALAALSTSAHAIPEACQDGFDMENYLAADDDFGSSKFGGSYSMGAGLYELSAAVLRQPCRMWEEADEQFPVGHPDRDIILEGIEGMIESINGMTFDSLSVRADADVRVFGRKKSVLDVSANASTQEAGVYVEVMGQTIFDINLLASNIQAVTYLPLFGKNANIDLGIFEISVGAEAAGIMGVMGSANATGGSVTANLTPVAGLNINAEASFSVAGASAGVRGELDVLTFQVPTTAEVSSSSWELSADATVDAIEGYLEAFGSFAGAQATYEICSFDGFNLFDEELFSASGNF